MLPQVFVGLVVIGAGLLLLVACMSEDSSARLPATISGTVSGPNGPVANAIVQIQSTDNKVTTGSDGSFSIHGQGLGTSAAVTITAWANDHFISWVTLDPQQSISSPDTDKNNAGRNVQLVLQPIFDKDNHDYNWFKFEGLSGSATCGICHREYKEWQTDMHSQSATNPRFISMYRGSDVHGKRSPPTEMISEGQAKPPNPAMPYYGPGFKLDNLEQSGTCATCHTPLAAKTPTTNTCAWSGCHSSNTADRADTIGKDVRGVTPVGISDLAMEGISCEFCHAIRNVIVDSKTKLPAADMPGIMSLELRRPPDGEHLFFGSLSDSNRAGVSFLPLQSESQFCAACHFGVFGGVVSNMKMTGGTVIYNSYGEWLDSPYSKTDSGKLRTCQDCHMLQKDTQYSVAPERGGVARDASNYHDHTMTGPSTSQTFMWTAVNMQSDVKRDGQLVRVHVNVTNDNTGHAVPTDAPMRSVMLVVQALDAKGNVLTQTEGPTLPDWTGNYTGQAGKAFARILKDNWTGEVPTSAFWRQVTVVEDTRLFPFKTDSTSYAFALPAGVDVTVKVKLVYRRAFQKLAQQKGWTDPDLVMAEATLPVQ